MKLRKLTGIELFLMSILVLYCLGVSLINPEFLKIETLFDLLRSSAGTMILAMGVLVVLISGGIDVSFTAIAIFGAYSATRLILTTGIDNLYFAFLISCSIGISLGLINALIIHFFKLQTLICTLGTASIFHGIMTTLIGTSPIGAARMPESLSHFGMRNIFEISSQQATHGLSLMVIPVVLVIIFTWFILYKTMLGRGIFAMGNSEEAAIRVGFSPLLIKCFVYCFIGFVAGLAGVMSLAEVNFCNPLSIVGTELSVIAAVVVGGAKLTGGQGTVFGTILGVLIVFLLNTTLIFLGLNSSWNNFFIGLILLFSIAATSYQQRIKNRRNLIFTE